MNDKSANEIDSIRQSCEQSTNLKRAFTDRLNRHGYSFQYSVLDTISNTTTSVVWAPWVSELPVGDETQNARIDFVLTDRTSDRYLVCECKRANPALSSWCFAKAGFQADSDIKNRLYMETLEQKGSSFFIGIRDMCHEQNIYHIGVEVKSGEKGDAIGEGAGQIEKAATQVIRGQNGLIRFFAVRNMLKSGKSCLSFMPVIFTTAKLWVTSVELSKADIESGTLDHNTVMLEQKDWIWFLYSQGPGLKHSIPSKRINQTIGEILFREFARPIAIVNPAGISSFLNSTIWLS